jgi:SynChlorMet cassette radical SAM/SPASM protein ScmE
MSVGGEPVRDRTPLVMRTPREVNVDITSRCNLRCRYCYFFEQPDQPTTELATAEWCRFFDECGDAKVMRVVLAGGEPFIREDLPLLLDSIVRNHMRYAVLSNGGLITDSIAGTLARSGRCDYVQVSIDGSRAAVHDSMRGTGSFDAALRGLRTLQRHGVDVTARVTIHRRNVEDLESIAHLLLDDLGLSSFGTNSAGYLGTCRKNPREVVLDHSDRQRAMETLVPLERRYPGRITADAGPLADAHRWRRMLTHLEHNAVGGYDGGRLSGCGCVFSSLAVRADGVYVPCCMMASMEMGRVGRDRLVDVWRNSPVLSRLRNRPNISLADFGFCRDCPYIPYCTGNCPALALSLTGTIDHPSPDACLRQFLEQGGMVPAPLPQQAPVT